MQSEKQLQFTCLLNKHKGIVYKVLLKHVSRDWHEDIYQDIALRAWEAYDTFTGKSQFSSWLHSIAYNATIDRLRRLRVQANRMSKYNWFYEYTTSVVIEPYQERQLPVIDSLSDVEKRTLQMRLDGLSFEQISDISKEPVSRLIVRMHRIKARLSKAAINAERDQD
jgi:RNA polymerase sigma factor (sigma-70 family)